MIDPLLIATISVIGGAILNTVRGFLGSDETTYDIKKFFDSTKQFTSAHECCKIQCGIKNG